MSEKCPNCGCQGKLTVSGKSHCNKCNWIWIQKKDYIPVVEQLVDKSEKFDIWSGDYLEKIFEGYKKDFANKMKQAHKEQVAYKKAIEFAPISDMHVSDFFPEKKDKYPLHCQLWLAGYEGDQVQECCKVCHGGSLDHSWGFRHTLNKNAGGTEYVVCCQIMKICLKQVSDVG